MTVWFDKARGRWRYHFEHEKQRHTGYCLDPAAGAEPRTKTEAKAIERQIRAAIEVAKSAAPTPELEGEPAKPAYTLAQAMAAWMPRKAKGGAHWKNQLTYMRELLEFFDGGAKALLEVTEAEIWRYIEWARLQPVMIWVGGNMTPAQATERGIDEAKLWRKTDRLRVDSTINRYLNVMREVIAIAARTRDPETGEGLLPFSPEVPILDEPEIQPNPISDEDLLAIIAAAEANGLEHIADAAFIVRNMGFRKAEVFGILLSEISHNRQGIRIPAERTKGNREEFIPANPAAWERICRLAEQAKRWGSDHLINFRRAYRKKDGSITYGPPRPVAKPDRAWRSALKLAGLEGRYIFHNTKASFVTDHATKNPAKVTQAAARHKDARTTDRYIKFADGVMKAAMDRVEFRLPEAIGGETDPHTSTRTQLAADIAKSLVGATGFEPATPRPPVLPADGNIIDFNGGRPRK